jgi:hypothetical protein
MSQYVAVSRKYRINKDIECALLEIDITHRALS